MFLFQVWQVSCALSLFSLVVSSVNAEITEEEVLSPATANCTFGRCGEKLFLTTYLKKQRIPEAREAARVPPMKGNVESYSGFFTVDEQHESNMFFWFFPSETARETSPVVLYLDGTPGSASFPWIFDSMGPYHIDNDGQVVISNFSWTKTMNVLYIDNPVGAGFSFTRNNSGYSVNQDDVRRNLYSAVCQFFQLFPEFQKNEFFIAGWEYAGKFMISLARSIHENNPDAPNKINLKGIAIEEGIVDPVNQLGYSDYLYNLGLIDTDRRKEFARVEEHIRTLVRAEKYEEAMDAYQKYIEVNNGNSTLFAQATGLTDYHNYVDNSFLETVSFPLLLKIRQMVNQPDVRKMLHVGDEGYSIMSKEALTPLLKYDFLKSVAPWLEEILNHYRVLVFNGQLSIITGYPMAMNYVHKIKWNGADEYRAAKRRQWHVKGELAGYAKTGGNLTDVLVRNAGFTISEKPLRVLELMAAFTKNLPIGGE